MNNPPSRPEEMPPNTLEDATLSIAPNPLTPTEPNLPILRIEYPHPLGRQEKPLSFGFTPTDFATRELNDWVSDLANPTILWSAEDYSFYLAFGTSDQRADCIARLARGTAFTLNLKYEVARSFLVHSLDLPWGRPGIEAVHVKGEATTILSPGCGDRGFVFVSQRSLFLPRLIVQRAVVIMKVAGNWLFMAANEPDLGSGLYIFECATSRDAGLLRSSFRGRAFRLISDGGEILAATRLNLAKGETLRASHSEHGQPNRIPFAKALERVERSLRRFREAQERTMAQLLDRTD